MSTGGVKGFKDHHHSQVKADTTFVAKESSLVQKADPHLRNIGATLLVTRNIVRLAGKSIKELRATLLFNGLLVPIDLWGIVKKVRKTNSSNIRDNSLAIGVKFSSSLKNTSDILGGLSNAGVPGEQLVIASNWLLGVGAALSVLAIIVNVKSHYQTKKFLKGIEGGQKTAKDIIANLRVRDPETCKKITNVWNKTPKLAQETKLKELVKERYSQKIRSIKLAILCSVISIVAISIILAAVATPVGWGLLATLGILSIAKYCYDKHAYAVFKEKVKALPDVYREPQPVEEMEPMEPGPSAEEQESISEWRRIAALRNDLDPSHAQFFGIKEWSNFRNEIKERHLEKDYSQKLSLVDVFKFTQHELADLRKKNLKTSIIGSERVFAFRYLTEIRQLGDQRYSQYLIDVNSTWNKAVRFIKALFTGKIFTYKKEFDQQQAVMAQVYSKFDKEISGVINEFDAKPFWCMKHGAEYTRDEIAKMLPRLWEANVITTNTHNYYPSVREVLVTYLATVGNPIAEKYKRDATISGISNIQLDENGSISAELDLDKANLEQLDKFLQKHPINHLVIRAPTITVSGEKLESLTTSLKKSVSLKHLELDFPIINISHAAYIAELLRGNNTIEKLVLRNSLNLEGVKAVLDGHHEETSLQTIEVEHGNELSFKDLAEINDIVDEQHDTLEFIARTKGM